MNRYETVFILNPVLSDDQIKEAVKKFEDYLLSKGAEMIWKEDWGLKKLAYAIDKKKSGFYHMFDYKLDGQLVAPFELEFRRDDSILRYLTIRLDKHAATWADVRRERVKEKQSK